MGDKLAAFKNSCSAENVLEGSHTVLNRFSLKGGASEEAGAYNSNDSVSSCCIIHKKISREQTCEQSAYTCKPVNRACN